MDIVYICYIKVKTLQLLGKVDFLTKSCSIRTIMYNTLNKSKYKLKHNYDVMEGASRT